MPAVVLGLGTPRRRRLVEHRRLGALAGQEADVRAGEMRLVADGQQVGGGHVDATRRRLVSNMALTVGGIDECRIPSGG
jgi:hypothetical protein